MSNEQTANAGVLLSSVNQCFRRVAELLFTCESLVNHARYRACLCEGDREALRVTINGCQGILEKGNSFVRDLLISVESEIADAANKEGLAQLQALAKRATEVNHSDR